MGWLYCVIMPTLGVLIAPAVLHWLGLEPGIGSQIGMTTACALLGYWEGRRDAVPTSTPI